MVERWRRRVAGGGWVGPRATGRPRPLKVLHLLHRLSADGGVQVVVRRLADGIDPARVELHVATARHRVAEDALDLVPASIHALGTGWDDGVVERWRTVLRSARLVRALRPDVVHLHSGVAWMGALVRVATPRAGVVLEVHDAPGSGRHGRLTDRVEGWWVRFLGAVAVCHSRSVESDLARTWHPRPGRVRVFPLAVDSGRIAPLDAGDRRRWRADHGLGEDEQVVVVAGRLVPSKRAEVAVEAVAQLRAEGLRASLVVAGRGPSEASVRTAAARHDVESHVRMLGFVDADGFRRALGGSDVMCSSSSYEGFGLTLVEGMATGLPVVATAVGGVTDVVVDGVTGLLVADGDHGVVRDRLVVALRRVLTDDDLRCRLGVGARRHAVEAFGVPAFATSFADLYEDVASGRRGATSRQRAIEEAKCSS